MRNSTLLYGSVLLWIASEMLEILTIIIKKILKIIFIQVSQLRELIEVKERFR